MSEPKLTENMIATAVTSMLCNACGCQPLEALDTWDGWLVEHDRKTWEQGHQAGIIQSVTGIPADNPYRKEES
ncbi:hypothetical protein [Bifidobacterium olomucense]|uniref:Uncharacterized protein n=1 Tax=Bifidobacterium olomucense TaxID=2675324 RepID=A0A7Y0HVB7_9BIFI|nr:hypothetical protein [Bifidobacterium sp. DSM 109959]NMM98100.1 hypothetical protein [Bifidobacterium sp. DSM 109959]